jgi:hypothetical protein
MKVKARNGYLVIKYKSIEVQKSAFVSEELLLECGEVIDSGGDDEWGHKVVLFPIEEGYSIGPMLKDHKLVRRDKVVAIVEEDR